MSRLKKTLVSGIVLLIICISGFLIWISNHYVIPVLMYHSVDYSDSLRPNSVNPENFEKQLIYLRDHEFRVLSFDRMVKLITNNEPLPKKSAVITFDDGYADNYTHAFGILKKYGFPAIVFIPSDLAGTEGYLSWEQMREMVKHGIAFGSHSRRHAYLPDLSVSSQQDEIFESKRILEENLGVSVDYFAYPSGGFSEPIKRLVREAGYKGAAATNRGYDRFNKDVFELNRVRLSDKDVRWDYLWIKLSGYYNLFRKSKNPY